MKKLDALLFALALAITGCNPIGVYSERTAIQQSTQPATRINSTTVLTLIPVTPSVPEQEKACPSIQTVVPKNFLSKGTIILGRPDVSDDERFYTFTTNDKLLRTISLSAKAGFEISPDGQWIAQAVDRPDGSISEVRLMSSDGNIGKTISVDQKWNGFHWQGNDLALIEKVASRWTYYNTVTGKTTDLEESGYSLYPSSTPVYNPTLTQAVFQQENNGVVNLVLWDIQASKSLWEIYTGETGFLEPEWSPDGSQFAVGIPLDWFGDPHYQLFIVDREGNAKQVTHFTGGLSHPPEPVLYQPHWSPNGRYIAFWYAESLVVFDTTTEKSTDYCLLARTGGTPVNDVFSWSPDSRQIVLNTRDETGYDHSRVVVVDNQTRQAIQIASGFSVIGWMLPLP